MRNGNTIQQADPAPCKADNGHGIQAQSMGSVPGFPDDERGIDKQQRRFIPQGIAGKQLMEMKTILLKKIKTLAEQGVDGEKESAQPRLSLPPACAGP